jgi:hypothetical protein
MTPDMRPVMHPEAVCYVLSFSSECEAGSLRKRKEEARHSGPVHTRWLVLTSGEFLARLAADENPIAEEDEGVDMDCWEMKAKCRVKLAAESELADPAAPHSDWALMRTSCHGAQGTTSGVGGRPCAHRLIVECPGG